MGYLNPPLRVFVPKHTVVCPSAIKLIQASLATNSPFSVDICRKLGNKLPVQLKKLPDLPICILTI